MMLAPRPPAAISTQVSTEMVPLIGHLAEYVASCTLEEGASIHATVASLVSALDDIKKALRNRMLEAIVARGKTITDKGTKVLKVEGWELEARPQRTGVDAAKLESLLRARGADPTCHMQSTISYKVDDAKLQAAVAAGVISAEEVESCKYEADPQYAVQPPRRRSDG